MGKIVIVLLAALPGGLIGALFRTLGLVLPDPLVIPLSLVMAALFSALGSGWAGQLLFRKGKAAELAYVIRVGELIAFPLGLILGLASAAGWLPSPPIVPYALSFIPIYLGVTASALALRREAPDLRRSVRTSVWSLILAALIVTAVFMAASMFGVAGA